MASVAYNGNNYFASAAYALGDRLGGDFLGDGFVQPTATALAPLARYKTRGQYAGAAETWTDSFAPTTPAPSLHTTTETGHTKSVG